MIKVTLDTIVWFGYQDSDEKYYWWYKKIDCVMFGGNEEEEVSHVSLICMLDYYGGFSSLEGGRIGCSEHPVKCNIKYQGVEWKK